MIGMRVVLLVIFSGICLISGPSAGIFAQDRPAISRPKTVEKKSEGAKTSSSGKKSAEAKADNENSAAAQGQAEGEQGAAVNIGKILPKGRILKGVKLPSYSGDRLSSVMTAVTMQRLDERHLGMKDLRITMYAKPGEKNTLISTEDGIYDLQRREITSDTRTRIEQGGVFDLEGDHMVFDANTQKGHMTGNVEMLIYKVEENLMPGENGAEKKKENGRATGNEK